MTCQQCGAENPSGNRFCLRCGAELAAPTSPNAEEGVAETPGAVMGAQAGEPGSSSSYTNGSQSPQEGFTRPPQGGYAPPAGQPSGQPGGSSNPYSAPPNPAMIGQGYAYQGQPGMVWSPDQLVGFGPRLGAYLIDWIILVIVEAILRTIHLDALTIFVGMAYFGYFWGTTGQSLGMKALGMKVVRADGQPLSVVLAIARYLCYFISAIPILLGFFWIIWDSKKQGFHDKIVGTVVVRA